MSIIQRRSPSANRGEVRNARLLDQKRGPEAVVVGVLVAALLLGLVGLAVHALWIVAIIVMALGLGFAAANGRRDKIDVVNRSADREDQRADEQDEQQATQGSDAVRPDRPARQS